MNLRLLWIFALYLSLSAPAHALDVGDLVGDGDLPIEELGTFLYEEGLSDGAVSLYFIPLEALGYFYYGSNTQEALQFAGGGGIIAKCFRKLCKKLDPPPVKRPGKPDTTPGRPAQPSDVVPLPDRPITPNVPAPTVKAPSQLGTPGDAAHHFLNHGPNDGANNVIYACMNAALTAGGDTCAALLDCLRREFPAIGFAPQHMGTFFPWCRAVQ